MSRLLSGALLLKVLHGTGRSVIFNIPMVVILRGDMITINDSCLSDSFLKGSN